MKIIISVIVAVIISGCVSLLPKSYINLSDRASLQVALDESVEHCSYIHWYYYGSDSECHYFQVVRPGFPNTTFRKYKVSKGALGVFAEMEHHNSKDDRVKAFKKYDPELEGLSIEEFNERMKESSNPSCPYLYSLDYLPNPSRTRR